jgi:hypothetical protein
VKGGRALTSSVQQLGELCIDFPWTDFSTFDRFPHWPLGALIFWEFLNPVLSNRRPQSIDVGGGRLTLPPWNIEGIGKIQRPALQLGSHYDRSSDELPCRAVPDY